jgi:hypothetical protein
MLMKPSNSTAATEASATGIKTWVRIVVIGSPTRRIYQLAERIGVPATKIHRPCALFSASAM